jgi:hypothetical protein
MTLDRCRHSVMHCLLDGCSYATLLRIFHGERGILYIGAEPENKRNFVIPESVLMRVYQQRTERGK